MKIRLQAAGLLPFCLLVMACTNEPKSTQTKTSTVRAAPVSLEPFADSMVRLDKVAPESIATAAHYYSHLVPTDSTLADSAAVSWLQYTSVVIDSVTSKLLGDTADYFNLVYNDGKGASATQKRLQQKLAANHIVLQGDGEGGVYAVLDYAWAMPLLQQKTSSAVDEYLQLLADEESKPTLLDAGLAIEMENLVDRLVRSEALLKKRLPERLKTDAVRKNRFYTSVLLLGSDNTPALDFESEKLTEEFAAAYRFLLQQFPASEAAGLVREWQQVVASADKQKLSAWRKKYSLYE